MGFSPYLAADRYPVQSGHVGARVEVRFIHGERRALFGVILRDDAEGDHRTIIRLDDGRVVLGGECLWGLAPRSHPAPTAARSHRMVPLRRVSGRDPREDYAAAFALYLMTNAGIEFGEAVAVADTHAVSDTPETDAEAWLTAREAETAGTV